MCTHSFTFAATTAHVTEIFGRYIIWSGVDFAVSQGPIEADVTVIMKTCLRTVIQSVIGMDRSSTLVVSTVSSENLTYKL